MNNAKKNLPALALAVSLSALGLGSVTPALADTSLAFASAGVASAQSDLGQVVVLKSENLYRFQQRPWMRIPEGVALHVKAPAGMSAADLHNALVDCSKSDKQQTSPLCVQGAVIKVVRNGGNYVVRITSDSRPVASQIQQRAAK